MGILSYISSIIDTALKEQYDNQPKTNYVWDDFSFPVTNLRVNPATSKPDFDQNEIEFLFDDATTETLVGSQITSHTFKSGVAGLEWRPHIHRAQEAVGVVKRQLEYKIRSANEAEPVAFTTITTIDTELTYTSGSIHQISSFPAIDVSTIDTTACITKVKVSRLGGDAQDTYVGDARFDSFDFHVPIDQEGSRQEFIK